MSNTSIDCLCGGSFGNTGLPQCVTSPKLVVGDVFMNAYENDGTRNGIKLSDFDANGNLPLSYILSMLDNPYPSKRWHLLPSRYEEVSPGRTDAQQSESALNTVEILRLGVKTFSGEVWKVPSSWAANLNRNGCNEVAKFSIFENGAIEGELSSDGQTLYPLLMEKGSLKAEPFDAETSKNGYTLVTYQLSRSVNEARYLTLPAGKMGANLLKAKSLITVCIEQDATNSNTSTEIFVRITNPALGTFGTPYALVGATTPTDYTLINKATSAAIVPTIVEDLGHGLHKLTIPSTPTATILMSYLKARTSAEDFGFIADQVEVTTGV